MYPENLGDFSTESLEKLKDTAFEKAKSCDTPIEAERYFNLALATNLVLPLISEKYGAAPFIKIENGKVKKILPSQYSQYMNEVSNQQKEG